MDDNNGTEIVRAGLRLANYLAPLIVNWVRDHQNTIVGEEPESVAMVACEALLAKNMTLIAEEEGTGFDKAAVLERIRTNTSFLFAHHDALTVPTNPTLN
jgi:hypothetical protein